MEFNSIIQICFVDQQSWSIHQLIAIHSGLSFSLPTTTVFYSSFIVEHYPGFSGEHHLHLICVINISKDTAFLLQPGRFYILPKIYKTGNPGCPIVSSSSHPTERISQFVNHHLKALAHIHIHP